jgi:hypothetical protein
MPNHVKIKLTIKGPDKDVKRFVAQARAVPPMCGPGDGNYQPDKKREPLDLSFHAIVPLPQSYSERSYTDCGYDLEHETWGTKWGAYDQEPPTFADGAATYSFTCAWGHPDKWLRKAAASWPSLKFFMSYGGEGPTRGRLTYQRDQEPKKWTEEGAARYPSDDEGLSDDEYCDQYDLAQEHFIRTHHAWAESTP